MVYIQDLDVGQDALGVRLEAGNHARFRASGEDDVLGFERLDAAFGVDLHCARAGEFGVALDDVDFVLLHEKVDTFGVLADDLVLASADQGPIEARVFALDALVGGMSEVFPDVGGMEERFRRDAADQEAGATEAVIFFDEGGLEAVLTGADCRGVAAGAAPDHDYVVCHVSS